MFAYACTCNALQDIHKVRMADINRTKRQLKAMRKAAGSHMEKVSALDEEQKQKTDKVLRHVHRHLHDVFTHVANGQGTVTHTLPRICASYYTQYIRLGTKIRRIRRHFACAFHYIRVLQHLLSSSLVLHLT